MRAGWILRQILGRALLPHHIVGWIRRRRQHRRVPTVHANAQLQLYNRILPGDFLHYGYFDDPDTPPEKISFDALHRAQRRYAKQITALIERPDAPILDVGSGMGGMLGLLSAAGHDVTGLTPDRFQVEHIGRTYPGVPILQCHFEDMPAREYRGRFGTVIHAESIQYMNPREVFPVVREVLAPGGTWIVADYFRDGSGQGERSGWPLAEFRRRVADAGFHITSERDITANVLPTLAFAHLLATRLGLPALDFAHDKLHAKAPAVHYVLENVVERARGGARRSTAVIDPATFTATKRYLLMTIRRTTAVLAAIALAAAGRAADPLTPQDVTIVEYEPRSTLVVPGNPLTRAKFPFVDIHGHQRAGGMSSAAVDQLVGEMDELNMAVMVNLSGGSGFSLAEGLENMTAGHPSRFVFFANTNFFGVGEPGWGEEAAAQLEADVRNGAAGLKIFKGLGMADRDTDGNRIPVDDPRMAPLWDKAGELGIPVLIHSADPAEFWQPHDRFNERWLELRLRPRRIRPPDQFPSFEQIIGEQHNLFRNHPNTNFIAAHLGWLGHDLARLGELLDEIPNMYVGLGAVVYELGRQPRFAREWLIEYGDRVLMGKDSYNQEEFHTYFRVFETEDDYFDYYRNYHAFWQMYGLGLPDDVLRKIYYENALRIVPAIDGSLFPG